MNDKLKEIFEGIWAINKTLSIEGRLTPGALFISSLPKKSGFFVPFTCQNEEEKQAYSSMVHALARKVDPDIIVFSTEGWGVAKTVDEKDMGKAYERIVREHGSLENAPERQELLITAASDRDGNRITRIANIVRSKRDDGKDVVEIDEGDMLEGPDFDSRFLPRGWGSMLDEFDVSGITKH